MVDEKSNVAEVIHRYEPSPLWAEKAAAKKAEAERRAAEKRRAEAAKRSASRLANRGVTSLRRERTAHEKIKRLRTEMEVAVERGQLVEREVVLRQAGFIFLSLRQAILGFPSRYARTVVGITDPREAQAVLTRAAHEFLNELSGFAEKMSDPAWTSDSDAEPLGG